MSLRTVMTVSLENPIVFKKQLLAWSQDYREIVWMDRNGYHDRYGTYDAILAVDAFTAIQTDCNMAFESLRSYQGHTRDWIFGYLSYDVKNDVEALSSKNFDGLNFPDVFFFQPKKLFFIRGYELKMMYLKGCDDEMTLDLKKIHTIVPNFFSEHGVSKKDLPLEGSISQRISKEAYLEKVQAIKNHIGYGDVYEVNFCMEFFANPMVIDPWHTYQRLNAVSEPPFAVFFKNNKEYLLCASPERYLKKEGATLWSQPIKGTSRRDENPVQDQKNKDHLVGSLKERTENIMIVDLVRNDLSQTAQKGSVKVVELCGVYSFKQVHHLISTVTSKIKPDISIIEVLKSTFPMGSMTGAPKISAMNIIEAQEETRRGLYSGAVGYITPDNDFDFNVVIRSILYSEKNKYLSFSVGSAITMASVPEEEYEECLLKAHALLGLF